MSYQTKPIHQYFNQARYLRHKQKLATIDSSNPQPTSFDLLTSMRKLRHHSLAFHQHEQEDHITHQNQKLLTKLLEISKRKSSEYGTAKNGPKMVTFNNPARKKREKMITEMNMKMAQKMLTLESSLDRKTMRRSLQQYETIKKTMSNNRKHMSLSSQLKEGLPEINNSQLRKKRKVKIELDEGNPEVDL